ncbi:MAG: hypothetical protein D6790_05385 [Caldilineae bacterium]|nr:MAG: hypothetical protein D6790_05385 [Caldilineae bacterium]
MAQPRRRKPRRPQEDRLPGWWKSISRRADVLGRLAERLVPAFEERPWLPFLLLLFPVLLLLLALVVNSLR